MFFLLLGQIFLCEAALWTQLLKEDPAHGPAPRLGAAALSMGASLTISGGCSSSCCYAPLQDMWTFKESNWVNVSVSGAPSGRLYHGASPASPPFNYPVFDYYVFGGDDIQTGFLDDLFTVSLNLSANPPSAIWKLQDVSVRPPARASHSQNALSGGGDLIIFGGENENSTLSDAWVFETESSAWRQLEYSSDPAAASPGPRVQHAALTVSFPGGVRALIVSGGSDSDGNDKNDVWALALDASPPAWLLLGSSPSMSSPWPAARHGHALWGGLTGGFTGGVSHLALFLFGGLNSSVPDPANFLGDTWRFDVGLVVGADGALTLEGGVQGRFTPQSDGGPAPGPRALGVYTFLEEDIIYATGFSGFNGGLDDRLWNDVWSASAPRATL